MAAFNKIPRMVIIDGSNLALSWDWVWPVMMTNDYGYGVFHDMVMTMVVSQL